MDIHCPTCGEPWDSDHMQFDEPYEWDAPFIEQFVAYGSRFSGPGDIVRLAAEKAGWQFATNSVLSFTRCPACEKCTPLRDAAERRAKAEVIAQAPDSDDDGLAVELNEM